MFFVLTITPAFCASSRDVASRPGVVSVMESDDIHTPESTNVTNRAAVNSARSQSNTRNTSASRAGNTARRESATTKRETTNRTTQSRTTNAGARATQSRTARTASSRTPTVTARSASTQVRSASNTRAARSATNAIGTSQGATKNAVKSRTATAGKSRAASNTITRARTTSATALINSDVSGMMEYCKTQYTQCMDNFCDVLDDAQGRCSCSKNIKNYAKTSTAQKEANAALQDIAQQIQYIGLSRDEVETLFTQTEAELTMQGNTDNSQIKNSLDKIKEMIVDVKPGTAVSTETDSGFSFNLDGLLDFNLDSMGFDLASIFGNNNSGTSSISNQRGEQLYKTASARCKKSVLESCQAQGINITLIENSYDLEIDRACIAYERSLSDGNDDIVQTVRNAQAVLQRARLMVEQQKNVYDLRGCVGALDACMQDDFVCGSDYELCLDPTGKYIVEGEVVVGSTPGYVIEGASSVPPSKEYGNNTLMGTWYYDGKFAWGATTQDGSLMDYISKYVTSNPIRNTSSNMAEFLQHKIGYNEKGKNYGMCMSVLNKCQNLTYDKKTGNYIPNNQVITEYLARTLVQIKRAQDAVLADYAESCITDVSSCLSTNNFDTTASNSKQNIAINACRSQIKTCMSVNGNSASEPDPADLRNWVMAMMGALLDEDIPSGGNSGGSTGGNSGTKPGQSPTPTNNPYTQTNPKSPMLIQAHLTDVSTGAQIAVYEDTQTNACYANPANTSNVNDACVVKCDISSATSGICNPNNTVTLTVDNASAVSTYALRSGVSLTFNGLNTSSIKIALENGQLPSSLGWVRDLSNNTNYRFDGIVGPDGTEYYDKNGNRVRTGITAGTTLTAVYAYDGYKQACVDSGGTWQNESCSCTATGTIYDEETAACMCNVAENFTGTPTLMGCQCADGFEFANGTCRQKESGGTTPDQPEPDQPSAEQTACTNAGGTWNGTTCECGAGKEWNGTACVSTGGTAPDQPEPDLPSPEQYSFAQWCNAEGQETYHEPGTLSVDGVCTFENTSYNGGNANPFKFIKHATWQIVDTDVAKNQCLINGGFVHQYLQDNSKLTICACPDTEATGGNALAERENGVCKCMPSFVRDTIHAPYDCICPSGMQKSATLLMMDKVIDHTDDSLTIERLRRDYLGNANLQVNVHTGDFAGEVSAQTRLYDKNGSPITMPCSLYESVNASNGGHAFWMCKPTCTPIDTFKRVCEATNGNWNAASNKCSCDASAGLIWKDKMLPHCTCRTGSIYGGFKKDSFNPSTGSCECDSDREKWVFSDGEAKCVPIGSYCDDKTKACRCDASKNFTESSRVDTEMNADGYYYFNYAGHMTEDPSYHFGCRCKVGYEMVQGPDGKMVCKSGNEPDVPTQPSAEQTACTNAGGTWNGTTCECTNGLLWNGSKCLPKCSAGTYIGNNGAKSFADASCTCADVKVLVSNRITNGSVKTWLDGAVIQKQIKFDEHVWTVVQDDDSSPSNNDAYCVSADMNGLSSSCKQNSTNLYVNYDEPSCADVTYDACYEYELNTDRTDATLNKCCQFSGGEVFMFADTNNDGLFEASCHCGDVKSCVESSSNTCTAQMISNSMWDATKTWLGRDNNCYSTALLSSCRDNEAMSTCSCDNGRVTVTRGLTTYCLTREVASKVNACANSNGSWSINTTNHKVDCTCRTGGTLTDEGTCDYSTYDKCLNPESTNGLKGQWSGGSCMCSAYSGMPGVVSIKDDKGVIIGCGCNADKGFAPNSEKTACVCPHGMYEHNGYCKCPGTAISNGNGGCMCSAGYDMSLNVRLFHTEAGHTNGAQKWYTEKLLSNGWSECTELSIPTQKKTAGCLSSKFYMGPAAVINDPNVSFYDLLQVCPVNGACDSGTTPEWEDYASCTKIEVLDNYTYLYEQDGKPMTNSYGMQYSIKTPMGVTFDYKTGKFTCDAQRGFEIYPHIAGYTVSESGMDKTPVVALVNQSTTGYHYKRNYNDITYSSTDPIYATELELQNGSFVPKTDIAPNPNLINQVTGKIEPGYNGSIYGDVMKYGTAFPTDLMCGCGDGRKLDLTSGSCLSSCPAGTIDIDRFTYRYNVTNGDVFSDTCISTANLCDLANGIDFCPESDTTITKKEMPGKGYYYLTNGYVISAGENSRVKSGSKQCGAETDEYYFLWSNEYSDFLTCMRTDGCWYDLLNGKAEYDSSCNN